MLSGNLRLDVDCSRAGHSLAEFLLLIKTKSDGTSTDGRPSVVHKVSALEDTSGASAQNLRIVPIALEDVLWLNVL